jgi:hypothetical protein
MGSASHQAKTFLLEEKFAPEVGFSPPFAARWASTRRPNDYQNQASNFPCEQSDHHHADDERSRCLLITGGQQNQSR